jgi:hypothetical protein
MRSPNEKRDVQSLVLAAMLGVFVAVGIAFGISLRGPSPTFTPELTPKIDTGTG